MDIPEVTPATTGSAATADTAPLSDDRALLHSSTRRLGRGVDALDEAALAAPSRLPGWTRGHVVAHLALNAEALAAVLRGVVAGEAVPMYADDASRDRDIDSLATARPATVRSRLHGAATDLDDALAALPADLRDVVVERTPGSARTFRAGDVATMRRQEVEIHHADLGAGHEPADWPADLAVALVTRLAPRAAATLVATDVGRTWQGGPDDPTVTGTAADLGWWLTGRGGADRLTSDGVVPGIEAW